MNIATPFAPHSSAPPSSEKNAQYIIPAFLPYLSMTQLATKTPKKAPA
jgi:hypothetical protein